MKTWGRGNLKKTMLTMENSKWNYRKPKISLYLWQLAHCLRFSDFHCLRFWCKMPKKRKRIDCTSNGTYTNFSSFLVTEISFLVKETKRMRDKRLRFLVDLSLVNISDKNWTSKSKPSAKLLWRYIGCNPEDKFPNFLLFIVQLNMADVDHWIPLVWNIYLFLKNVYGITT